MSHSKVKSKPMETSSSVLWEHKSKRERSQVDKQRPRVFLQKSEQLGGTESTAGVAVPLYLQARTQRQRQEDHTTF